MFVTTFFLAIASVLGIGIEPPLQTPPVSITEVVAPTSTVEYLSPESPHLLTVAVDDQKEHTEVAIPASPTYCSCVLYVQSLGGKVSGNAINVIPTHFTPTAGDIAVMRYPGNVGHVAMVTKVEDSGFWITEANYHSCKKTERFIKNDYNRLVGFTR
jgi:hypothetical protein